MNFLVCVGVKQQNSKKNPEYKDVPVIALTASATAEEWERFISEDFDGFLEKPIIIMKSGICC